MNIIIVDDDPSSRLILGATLKKLGYQVTAAASAQQVLEEFERAPVPLLISDMMMPDMDGLELCQRIRALNRPQYTYIILLTSMSCRASFLTGMKAGADDFLAKPLDADMLAARLIAAERLLSLQSAVKQLSGLLPICCVCKKVRDDKNYWQQVESYIVQRTDAKFSHGYCPDCFKKATAEIAARKNRVDENNPVEKAKTPDNPSLIPLK